jgi:hypothetical protein
MSELGQSRRFDAPPATSGLPQSTDTGRPARLVRFVPKPDIRIPSSDRVKAAAETLVGDGHHRRRVLWER